MFLWENIPTLDKSVLQSPLLRALSFCKNKASLKARTACVQFKLINNVIKVRVQRMRFWCINIALTVGACAVLVDERCYFRRVRSFSG